MTKMRIVLEAEVSPEVEEFLASAQYDEETGRSVIRVRSGNLAPFEAEVVRADDAVEVLSEKLKKVHNLLKELKKAGIHQDVLSSYLRIKAGISQTTFEKMMKGLDDFFSDLGIEK